MSELGDLVDLLFSKTKEGKLHWRLDGERRITLTQGDSIVDVEVSFIDEVKIAIRNKDGIVVAQSEPRPVTSEAQKLHDIFNIARRDALRVDKTLGALKNSLLQL